MVNSVSYAVQNTSQPVVHNRRCHGPGSNKFGQRMRFKLKNFEQGKTLQERVELVEVIIDSGEPVRAPGKFYEDVFRNALKLGIVDLAEGARDFFLKAEL